MKEAPKRRHTLELKIDADSPEDVARALEEFSLQVRGAGREGSILPECQEERHGISAGWSWSWQYKHTFREGQTGDDYRAELKEYCEQFGEKTPA